MNSVTHTEPRSSISSSPKDCRNWPPRRMLVIRHCCHFVKQRIRLATQTTIELVQIKKTGECRVPPKPVSLLEERDRGAADGASEPQQRIPRQYPDGERNLLPSARSSFTSRLFWGEQPPLIPAQVWGAVIFWSKKSDHRYRAGTTGSNQQCSS